MKYKAHIFYGCTRTIDIEEKDLNKSDEYLGMKYVGKLPDLDGIGIVFGFIRIFGQLALVGCFFYFSYKFLFR